MVFCGKLIQGYNGFSWILLRPTGRRADDGKAWRDFIVCYHVLIMRASNVSSNLLAMYKKGLLLLLIGLKNCSMTKYGPSNH